MTNQTGFVDTSFGKIAYWDTGGTGPVVFFVHGNSASKRIFERQFNSDLAKSYRLIAMETLDALGLTKAALIGWSLGGHIVLEMLARWSGAQSAFILGTPPVPHDPERAMSAFLPSEIMGLTFQETFTDDEAAAFAGMNFLNRDMLEPWMTADAKRTDGRFRPIMLQGAMESRNLDEEEIAGTSDKPLAVVIGGEDGFVSRDFLNSVTYGNLWGGEVLVLEGRGHAPFWEAPEEFNALLGRFLEETTD